MSTPRCYDFVSYDFDYCIVPLLHIMRPKLKGRVAQFSGKRNVLAGCCREPGASGLIKPSTQMRITTAEG